MAENQNTVDQQREANKLQQQAVDLSYSLIENLKELLGVRSKLTEFEKETLTVNKEIAKLLNKQNSETTSIAEKTKEIVANEQLIRRAQQAVVGLTSTLTTKQAQRVQNAKKQIDLQNSLTQKIQDELKKAENGEVINKRRLAGLKGRLIQQEGIVEAEKQSLTPLQQQLLLTYQSINLLEQQNKLRIAEKKLAEEQEEALRKSLGLAGGLLGFLGKIPVIGESARKAYEKIKKEAEDTQAAGGALPSRFQNLKKVLSETGAIFKEKLTDPTVLIGGLVTLLIKGFNKFDQAVVGVQKRLALSREEAGGLVREFTTFNSLLTSTDLLKSVGAIQDKLGSVGKVSRDTAETFGRLNTLVGLSEEGAAGLAAQADAFGKSASEVYKTSVGTTAQISRQYKTNINQKAVLEAVGKASSYTLAQFRGSTQALTEGVAKAKALGISLETLNKSASGLLNFQQSIEDELAAELITGKQLNLEQARYYALTNQQSKLMDELNSQIGTYSDFTQQTVLAQEAQAKALGMSTVELSDMLFKQQYMKSTAQEQAMTEEQIVQQRIEQLTLQEKLQKAVDKLSETFANFVAGPLGTLLTDLRVISGIIGFMAGSQLGRLAASFGPVLTAAGSYLGITTATAAATTATATAVSFGAMLPVILGAVGAVLGVLAASKADDLFSPGQGNSGYGKRVLIAPEGAFALNNKDNIIATTNPVRSNDLVSTGAGNVVVNQAPQTTVVKTTLNLNGRDLGNALTVQGPMWGGPRQNGGRVDYSA